MTEGQIAYHLALNRMGLDETPFDSLGVSMRKDLDLALGGHTRRALVEILVYVLGLEGFQRHMSEHGLEALDRRYIAVLCLGCLRWHDLCRVVVEELTNGPLHQGRQLTTGREAPGTSSLKGSGAGSSTSYVTEGIEKIIERRAMARRVLMVNEACALPRTDTAEASAKERLTHLSLLHCRAARRGEPWNPREESLKP